MSDVLETGSEAAVEPAAAGAGGAPDSSAQGQDWRAGMPESFREAVQGMDSAESALEALKRGAAHVPLADAAAVKINAPAGVTLSDESVGWLKEAAVAHGMSQAQLDAVVQGYNQFAEQAGTALKAQTEASLKKEYGARYGEVMARANDACRKFNELTGGGLSGVIESGLGNHPGFIKFMIAVSEAVSDSSLPGTPKGSGEAALSTTEFLSEVFANKGAAGA